VHWAVHLFGLVNRLHVSAFLDLASSSVNHTQKTLRVAVCAYHDVGVMEALKSSDVLEPAGCLIELKKGL
jgi:hypothetical protein